MIYGHTAKFLSEENVETDIFLKLFNNEGRNYLQCLFHQHVFLESSIFVLLIITHIKLE